MAVRRTTQGLTVTIFVFITCLVGWFLGSFFHYELDLEGQSGCYDRRN